MTDPTVAAAAGAAPPEMTGPAAQQAANPARFDPAETRTFANMMQAGPQGAAAVSSPSALGDAAKAMAAQMSGNNRSFEDMQKSLLASVDFNDPIGTMFAMTDHQMEMQMFFTKIHFSSSMASAATNVFGTLLKNQQ
ncbi:hypothetical protein [Variovorax paradoxus]|uniref:Uncharacterized protein n=1 Tax=Variovorax paradoxus (strain EPS) TaxID=595537 RepID=E6V258_VARPE|nr:hypothetical protein [Variovorax paradoxus]ADU39137.1 hypothetical protein Varpa_4977 [Variovorax paradoxus EPS]